jgi:hypothetical protein
MPSDSEPSTTSKVSLDLVIAVFALLISTTTAIASIYQSRVISSQLSASVWPYLSFTVSLGRSSARLLVTNVGEGPAIVKGARFAIDGSPQKSVAKALAKLLGIALDSSQIKQTASVAPGLVLRPGDAHLIFDMNGIAPAAFLKLRPHVRLSVCYCSLLSQCWITEDEALYPRSVRNCDDFQSGGIDA